MFPRAPKTIEYTLIHGLNDSIRHARELIQIEIPEDPSLEAERTRTKALSQETALLSQLIDALSEAGGDESRPA